MLAQGQAREERPLVDVRQVVMEDFGDLTILFGEFELLVVEAEGEMLSHVASPVVDGKLSLSLDRKWQEKVSNSFTLRGLRYTLTLKTLESLEVNGLARVHIPKFSGDSLQLRQTGRVKTTIDALQVNQLECITHWGSRVVILSGNAKSQKITLSHSSKYTADQVTSESAEAALSVECQASLRVRDTLTVEVGEDCALEYAGEPALQVTGTGVIKKLATS